MNREKKMRKNPYGTLTMVGAKFSSSLTIDLCLYRYNNEVRAKIVLNKRTNVHTKENKQKGKERKKK